MSTTIAIVCLVSFFGQLGQADDAPQAGARADAAAAKTTKALPSSVQIVREPDVGTLGVAKRDYRVRCRILSKSLSFSTPRVTVRDGERTTVSDRTKRSIVVGHKTDGNSRLPVSRDVSEGTTVVITAIGVDGDRVVVDVAIELQGATTKSGKDGPSMQVSVLKGRFITTAKLGASVQAESEGWSADVEIDTAE